MTKLQFRVLYREFLFRIVDLEVLSAHALGDVNRLLGQFAALLIFISLLLSLAAIGFAGASMTPARSLIFTLVTGHFLIATTMLSVRFERQALQEPRSTATMLALVGMAAVSVRWGTRNFARQVDLQVAQ